MSSGKIVQVIGPVVDIEFPAAKLPAIYNAIHIPLSTKEKPGDGGHLTVEVASHLGDNLVRAISLGPTDGLQRGMEATDTGAPLTVPVGRPCLGRLMDVLGEPKDERGPIQSKDRLPIHRPPPPFVDQVTKPQIFETGVKVWISWNPIKKAAKWDFLAAPESAKPSSFWS
jgi:F-type H+-transporting ATPase subunit beta